MILSNSLCELTSYHAPFLELGPGLAVNEGSVARRFVIFGSGTDGDMHVAAAMSHIGESGYVQLAMAQLVFLLEVEGVVIYE